MDYSFKFGEMLFRIIDLILSNKIENLPVNSRTFEWRIDSPPLKKGWRDERKHEIVEVEINDCFFHIKIVKLLSIYLWKSVKWTTTFYKINIIFYLVGKNGRAKNDIMNIDPIFKWYYPINFSCTICYICWKLTDDYRLLMYGIGCVYVNIGNVQFNIERKLGNICELNRKLIRLQS